MKTIVTAGKGGTGKSMILSHLLRRHILGNGFGKVLVVDADPHQSLAMLLGAQSSPTLGELRHQHGIELKTGQGLKGMGRRDFARQLAQEAIVAIEGADLLVMGHNNQPGCQCVVNNILGTTLDAVAGDYDLVIVDNEAGIEPIGRHDWPLDYLLLVSGPRPMELDVVRQILKRRSDVKRETGCACLLFNRSLAGQAMEAEIPAETALLGDLPYSPSLAMYETPDDAWLDALERAWRNMLDIMQRKKRVGIRP